MAIEATVRSARAQADMQLIERLKRDPDRAADFRELYKRYASATFVFFLRRVGDAAAAADLNQELFLRLARSIDAFEGKCSWRTWVFLIARNVLAEWRGSRARHLAERNAFPAAPTSVVASRNDAHSIRVRWTASGAPDIAGYRVYRRASTLAAFELVGTTGAGASSYLDGGLATGTRYYYRVTAIDQAGGESAFSNESSAVPNPPNGCRDCEITNP